VLLARKRQLPFFGYWADDDHRMAIEKALAEIPSGLFLTDRIGEDPCGNRKTLAFLAPLCPYGAASFISGRSIGSEMFSGMDKPGRSNVIRGLVRTRALALRRRPARC
jgi:hypothetical protein